MERTSKREPSRATAPTQQRGTRGLSLAPPRSGLDFVDSRRALSQRARAGAAALSALQRARDRARPSSEFRLSTPSHASEREADAVADAVVGGAPVDSIKAQPQSFTVMRDPSGDASGGTVPSSVETGIRRARGGGRTLPTPIRGRMERSLGADLSQVRVHTGEQADTMSRSIRARAFTTGSDIFFKRGMYKPNSAAGQRLLAHELTHVVQQRGRSSSTIQRAIGLEIEVPVPVDQLTDNELQKIREWTALAFGNEFDENNDKLENEDAPEVAKTMKWFENRSKYGNMLKEIIPALSRKVDYSRNGAIARGNRFRAEVDHDDRVDSKKEPPNHPWRNVRSQALMEIVMDPPANNKKELDAAMDEIAEFVGKVNNKTANLTKHAKNPFGRFWGMNLGPIDYPDIPKFANLPREQAHSWKGSVQVNIGVDLREYASLASWYAQSDIADPSRASEEEQASYQTRIDNITKAVAIGRQIVDELSTTKTVRTAGGMRAFGNMRGLQGWLTHLALHMLGAITFESGGGNNLKNMTPILMKSPNTVAIEYGFTTAEKTYYENETKRKKLLALLIQKTGRLKRKVGTLGSRETVGDLEIGNFRGTVLSETNKLVPGKNLSLGQFAAPTSNRAPLPGSPINSPTAVGPKRTGNNQVSQIKTVGNTGQRGGVVVEFRNIPGFYDGPEAWRRLGQRFLLQAETRNKRGGVRDDSLRPLVGKEWPLKD